MNLLLLIGLEDNIDFFTNEFGENIEHNGIIKTAIIKNAVENINFYNDKLIICTFPINTGDIVKYKNETYFINSEADKNENTFKARLKKSNYIIKFMRNNEIKEYPVLLETSAQGVNSDKYFSVPAGQAQIMFEDTEELRKLVMVYNTRFIASKTSYKITSYDLSINGFITIIGEKDTVAVDEKVLQNAFIDVFNKLKEDSEGFVETLAKNIEKILLKRAENTDFIEIERKIVASKEEIKGLIKLQTKGQMDEEVYNEEYTRISGELEKLRQDKSKIETGNISIE